MIRKLGGDVSLWFLVPALVVSMVVVLAPAVLTFGASFTRWDGVSAPIWSGMANYTSLMGDRGFWRALTHNTQWLAIFLIVPTLLGIAMAALMFNEKRSMAAFQAIFLIPFVLSPVANALIWQEVIFASDSGLLGFISKNLFPVRNPLTNPETALYAVAAVDIWRFWGYVAVIFYAAMKQTPQEQLEAALIEGASGFQTLRYILVPNIARTILLMLVFIVIGSILAFEYVFLLTQGGPANSTELLSTLSYTLALSTFEVGRAAALAVVMSFFGFIASVVYVWLEGKQV